MRASPVAEVGVSERAALLQAIEDSPSYRLANEDNEFLSSDDLRPVRLQLEMLKPERELRRHKVQSTIVVFGSARLLSQAQAQAQLAALERLAGESGLSALALNGRHTEIFEPCA